MIALNQFDLDLKSLFYHRIMFVENALKSYAIEAVLQDAKSENLDDIFEKSITEYRFLKKDSMAYHNSYSKRMALKVKINNVLINSYNHSFNDIVNYFLIQTKIFQFGQYYNLLLLGSLEIFMFVLMLKKYISNEILHLPTKFDEDGKFSFQYKKIL